MGQDIGFQEIRESDKACAYCSWEKILSYLSAFVSPSDVSGPASIIMLSLTPEDLHDILVFAIDVGRKAGDLILEGSAAIQSASSESGVGEKKNSVDLVTEYDVRVEELVKKELSTKYPTFGL